MSKELNLLAVQGRIYDRDSRMFVHKNESGIVVIGDRRFVYDTLLDYLIRNGKVGKFKTKTPVIKQKAKRPHPTGKPRTNKHLNKAIIVTFETGEEKPFESCMQASRELHIHKCNVSHVLSGKYKQINGYKIRYAN